jgi:hypothetical protein
VHCYTAFGLDIASAFPLPELMSGKGTTDVEIRQGGALEGDPSPEADDATIAPGEARLAFRGVGRYVVRDGREIIVSPSPEVADTSLRLALLGPVMAVLLQQRRFLVLHASVVSIDGRAVLFLGASGWGKSTMAAALHARGHRLVVDDIAAVRISDAGAEVYPGFPQLKLWPDAVAALGEDAAGLPRLDPGYEKRARRVTAGFAGTEPLPLAHAFVLTFGDALVVERLAGREAFVELLRHSYGIQWLHGVAGAAQFFDRVHAARRIRVSRLTRPADLALLPAVAAAVEAELARRA